MYFLLVYRIASNVLSLSWSCIGNYIAVCFSVSQNCAVQHKNVIIKCFWWRWAFAELACYTAFMTICCVVLSAEPVAWRWAPLLVVQGGRLLVRHPFSMVCWAWCKDSFHSLIKVKLSISYTQRSLSLQVWYCFTVPINDDSVVLEKVPKGSNKLLVLCCSPVLGIFNKQ